METCDADKSGTETAKVFFELPGGRELSYCGHHADKYMDTLVLMGADVLDTRQPVEAPLAH